MGELSNISTDEFRRFLKSVGLELSRTNGGHEIWQKPGLSRPVIIQTHINPIPEFILKNNLRAIGCTRNDLSNFLKKKK